MLVFSTTTLGLKLSIFIDTQYKLGYVESRTFIDETVLDLYQYHYGFNKVFSKAGGFLITSWK
jgi:hypothetical protein